MSVPTPTHYDVFAPGAFDSFLSGTSVIAGEPWSTDPEQQRGADELRQAYREATTFRRGKGYVFGLRLPSIEAACVLAGYAEACIISGTAVGDADERRYYASEVAAARKVLERIEQATGGRVTYDGWGVRLDGERVT